ncbi:hypothetical protein OH76DRAFT_855650 [Lentinus brumalis]|uniref:Uncharacterized protein n=1 Tax=Lentinus brumalis TaxID=2498619 RepID=A0A371DR72_9APHY|nr:hypothetical protein OH76DRAFT_855650 [Polyporus brumalis]
MEFRVGNLVLSAVASRAPTYANSHVLASGLEPALATAESSGGPSAGQHCDPCPRNRFCHGAEYTAGTAKFGDMGSYPRARSDFPSPRLWPANGIRAFTVPRGWTL